MNDQSTQWRPISEAPDAVRNMGSVVAEALKPGMHRIRVCCGSERAYAFWCSPTGGGNVWHAELWMPIAYP